MKLTAIEYGKTTLGADFVFSGGDKNVRYPIALLFFCVQTGEKTILIDVGCDVMHGFDLSEHVSPVVALERAGIPRESVTDVVLTHGHEDHAEALHYYPNAVVTVHQNEVYRALRYAAEGQKINAIAAPYVLTDGVTVVPILGHSEGSSVVELQTKEGTTVLCGDECYHKDCFRSPSRSGGSINREKTQAFFEKYGADSYRKILFHDPDLVGKVGAKVLYEK